MTSRKVFRVLFHDGVQDEFFNLDKAIQTRLSRKLAKRAVAPINPADALSGELAGCYKLKDNKSGSRLVYAVIEDKVLLLVIAIGKRERLSVYKIAATRLKNL